MKKLLTVSLVAMMAVTTARADIASKAYVDSGAGNYVQADATAGQNIKTLDTNLKSVSDTVAGHTTQLPANGQTVADAIAAAVQELDVTGTYQSKLGGTGQGGKVVTASETAGNVTYTTLANIATSGNYSDLTVADGAIAQSKVNGLGTAASANVATTGVGANETGLVTGQQVQTAITNLDLGGTYQTQLGGTGQGGKVVTASETAGTVTYTTLGDLATKSEVAESDLATDLASKINGKADASSLGTMASEAANDYYTKTAADAAFDAAGSATAAETAAKGYTDTAIANMQVTTNLSSSIATDTGNTTKYPSVKAVEDAIAAAGTTAGNTYQAKSTANYQMGKSDGTWEAMTQGQQDALNSGATAAKVTGYDSVVTAVNDSTSGLAATKTIADNAAAAAAAAIPAPSGNCTDCVLHYNGSEYSWEEIARAGE